MTSNSFFRKPNTPLISTESRYAQFGWSDNPFPDKPGVIPESEDPRINGTTYRADIREREESDFNRLLIEKHPPRAIVFLMDFATRRGRGIGKTAFLSHQRRRIMADFGDQATSGERVMVATHVSPPAEMKCRRFWQLSQTFARGLEEQRVIAQAMWRIRAFSGRIPEEVLTKVDDTPEDTIGNDVWLEKQGVSVFTLNNEVANILRKNKVRDEVAQQLAWNGHLVEEPKTLLFQNWNDNDWRKHGSNYVFDDLVCAFRAADINQGLLLLDDVERMVTHQSIRERAAFAEDIRHYLIDGSSANTQTQFFSLLLTIHPYIQELLVTHWNRAGLDRFCSLGGNMDTEYTIFFHPLEATAARPLVIEYANRARIDSAERDTLRPFDLPALTEAMKLVQGLPGVMLALLHNVVEVAVKEGWTTIGSEQVRSVFERHVPDEADEPMPTKPLPESRINLEE